MELQGWSLQASRLTCLDGEQQPRAGEKNGARKSEPTRELLIFEFPAFVSKCSDLIGLNWQVTETCATSVHFTSHEPSVDFVQGVFLKLLINSDLSFELKLEQKIPVNCLLEGRDVFAVMPTGFGKSFFFSAMLSTSQQSNRKRFEKESM